VARLTQILAKEGGARAIGFDLVFAEPQPQSDSVLAKAFANAPVALGYYFSSEVGAFSSGQLPQPVWPAATLREQGFSITSWGGYGANVAPLARAARAAGFFNPMVDRDGVVRSLPLLAEHHDQLYESLAVSVLQDAAESIAEERPAKAAEMLAEAAYAARHGPSATGQMDRIARRAVELAPPRRLALGHGHLMGQELVIGQPHPVRGFKLEIGEGLWIVQTLKRLTPAHPFVLGQPRGVLPFGQFRGAVQRVTGQPAQGA
jgi:hypothetical protein